MNFSQWPSRRQQSLHFSTGYRPELDGLRALALISVIAYHADLGLPSGFLGVDTFFVISGYLITGQILRSLRDHSFSLSTFYLRRARRLLPMLFLVMSTILPFCYWWMTPNQLRDFSQSLCATSLSVSNLLFWHESGYFQPESTTKPLLHTWSLAIEEQFYCALPLLFWLVWKGIHQRKRSVASSQDPQSTIDRRQSHLFGICLVLWGLSLALCEWSWRYAPSFNYYSPLTRAWELLTGVLLALKAQPLSTQCIPWRIGFGKISTPIATAIAYLGLSLTLLSTLVPPTIAPHPSLYTLIPVLGVALTIWFMSAKSSLAKLLSSPILVWLGLISYGAYLWHQPLLALTKIYFLGMPLELPHRIIVTGLTCLLATLCKRYIEDPIRFNKSLDLYPYLALSLSLGGIIFFCVLGVSGHLLKGLPQRGDRRMYQVEQSGEPLIVPCPYNDFYRCILGDQNAKPRVALLGDSHAGMYSPLFDRWFKKQGIALRYAGDGWCVPLLDLTTKDRSKNGPRCAKHMSSILRETAQDRAIHTVILAAEWSHYVLGYRPGEMESTHSESIYRSTVNEREYLKHSQLDVRLSNTSAVNRAHFKRSLEATIRLFRDHGKSVIIIEPVPELSYHVPQVLASSIFRQVPPPLGLTKSAYKRQNHVFFTLLHELSDLPFRRWSTASMLCQKQSDHSRCLVHDEQFMPLYSDSNHLSARGVSLVMTPYLKSNGYK